MQGIYYLEINHKFYIGKSSNIEFRIKRHHHLLLRGAHPNPRIMQAWYEGDKWLCSGVVEICEEGINDREVFWITEFDAISTGLNMPKVTYTNDGNIVLVSPQGDLVPVHSAAETCREYNLDAGALSKLIHGKVKTHKGWKLYEF